MSLYMEGQQVGGGHNKRLQEMAVDLMVIHTPIQYMHIDRDGVFLLAYSEGMPRSALIGRAVPLLDPWDRSTISVRVQLRSNYTHLSYDFVNP